METAQLTKEPEKRITLDELTAANYELELFKKYIKQRPLSYSSLKAFQQSPAHYIAYLGKKFEQTEAMVFGSLVDNLLFTPSEVEKQFIKPPAPVPTLKSLEEQAVAAGEDKKLAREKWEAEKKKRELFDLQNIGKNVVTDEQMTDAKKIINSVMRQDKAYEIIDKAESFQTELKWTDEETGLPITTKLDIVSAGNPGKICDFKTSATAKPEACGGIAFNFGYHLQAGIYTEGYYQVKKEHRDYWMIFAEKEEPFAVSVHFCNNDFIKLGQKIFHDLLIEFKYCMENNLWHKSYDFRAPNGYFSLDLPGWAKNQLK